MSLTAVALNAGASLQDGGREGYRRFGVPVGGAFDRASLRLGNALLGNDLSAAALEFTIMGGRFETDADGAFALVGADVAAEVDGSPVPAGAVFRLRPGQRLAVGNVTRGVRAYLCVAGGFVGETTLGSVSGSVVRKGDTLGVGVAVGRASVAAVGIAESLSQGPFRIVRGPQADALMGENLAARRFEVSPRSNRVGIRLEGEPFAKPAEIVSEPMCVGAIQMTNDGGLIVIGPDGPTVGGYPKVACVIDADLDRLAQLLPGDPVEFEWLEVPEARALGAMRRQSLEAEIARIRACRLSG